MISAVAKRTFALSPLRWKGIFHFLFLFFPSFFWSSDWCANENSKSLLSAVAGTVYSHDARKIENRKTLPTRQKCRSFV